MFAPGSKTVHLLTYVGLPGRGDRDSHTEVAVRLLTNKHI